MSIQRPFAFALAALFAHGAALAAPIPGRIGRMHPLRNQEGPPNARALTAAAVAGSFQIPKLLYFGGRVVEHAKVVPVYWKSTGWPDGFQARLETFYASLVAGEHFEMLTEYNTVGILDVHGSPGTNQMIGLGTTGPSLTISNPAKSGTTISADDVEAELVKLTASIDLSDPDLMFMVHVPPGIVLRDPGFNSCINYCAFHSVKDNGAGALITYGLVPDHGLGSGCDRGCGTQPDLFDNMTSSASHEVVEIITDPLPVPAAGNVKCGSPMAWCDPAPEDALTFHDEIADICIVAPTNITEAVLEDGTPNRIVVQREWSNRFNACIVTAREAFGISIEPTSQHIVTGQTAYNFKVKSTALVTAQAAQLSVMAPSGVSANFSPTTIQAGGEATMTLNVSTLSSPDLHFAVFAESGRTLAMTDGTLGADDFSVTVAGPARIKAGGTATATLNVDVAAGSADQNITLQVTDKPAGVSIQGTPPTLRPGQSASLPLVALPGSPSTSSGALTLVLSNGALTHVTPVPVVVDGDDFTVAHDVRGQLELSPSGTAQFRIATATTHGNPQQLTLTADTLPRNVTASFNPPTLQSGGTSVVTLTSRNAPAAAGEALIQVSGPAISQPVTVTTVVRAGGCATAPLSALWPLGACAAWLLRRRRSRP